MIQGIKIGPNLLLYEPSGTPVEKKKRRVKYETYKKWLVEYDKDCQTMTWLDCETETERSEGRDKPEVPNLQYV